MMRRTSNNKYSLLSLAIKLNKSVFGQIYRQLDVVKTRIVIIPSCWEAR